MQIAFHLPIDSGWPLTARFTVWKFRLLLVTPQYLSVFWVVSVATFKFNDRNTHMYIYIYLCIDLHTFAVTQVCIYIHKSSTWKAPSFSIHGPFMTFWGSDVWWSISVTLPCRKLTYPTCEQGQNHLVGGWTNPFETYYSQNGNLPQFSGWTFQK